MGPLRIEAWLIRKTEIFLKGKDVLLKITPPSFMENKSIYGRQLAFTEMQNCGIIFFQHNKSSEEQHGQIDRLVLLP